MEPYADTGPGFLRMGIAGAFAIFGAGACLVLIGDPTAARAGALVAVCLALWLFEAVPPFVPTLLILSLSPLVIASDRPMAGMMTWMADPVLALFFGGLALGVAAQRHGIDGVVAGAVARGARGSPRRLLALAMVGTAGLSMWMSNIAAAAMMLAALAPVGAAPDDRLRRMLALGIAIAANLGGMGTPIGTGPNGIAIGSAGAVQAVTFAHWMAFGVPLVAAAGAVAWGLIAFSQRLPAVAPPEPDSGRRLDRRGFLVVALAATAAAAWMSEPWHGVSAAVVALALAAALFASGLLAPRDLASIDWSTLLLVAGGLGMGRLLEQAGLQAWISDQVADASLSPTAVLALLLAAAAGLAAVMSNTAAATLLIPLAMAIDPHPPQWAILVALAASFGMPFVVSTPPNAMAVGRGVRSVDLLWVGGTLMVGGVVVLTLTGPLVLSLLGVGGR